MGDVLRKMTAGDGAFEEGGAALRFLPASPPTPERMTAVLAHVHELLVAVDEGDDLDMVRVGEAEVAGDEGDDIVGHVSSSQPCERRCWPRIVKSIDPRWSRRSAGRRGRGGSWPWRRRATRARA